MKKIIPLFICTFLFSCTKHIKTYYPDGKIATEYSVDYKGRKNGLFKVYDKNGQLSRETKMIHDTLCGGIIYFHKSEEITEIQRIERGLYNISLDDTDFIPKIFHLSRAESLFYNKSNVLSKYVYSSKMINGQSNVIIVDYLNDTISKILGGPFWTSLIDIDSPQGMTKHLTIKPASIPKCTGNFYLMDSVQKVIGSCFNCTEFAAIIDPGKFYSMKVEYIDSTFHINHSIEIPFGLGNKKRFPKGIPINWTRE